MIKLNKILQRIIKSDLSWALIFFSAYISFYLDIEAGIFFSISFLLCISLVKAFKYLQKYNFLFALIYIYLFLAGYYFYSTPSTVGFILGSSMAGFLMSNFSILNAKQDNKKTADKLRQIVLSILIIQFFFTFYYFYNLIIQDVRGQNNLTKDYVLYAVIAFVTFSYLTQIILKKALEKKLDIISFANILFVIISAGTFVIFYYAFLEIGALNIIMPVIFSILTTLVINTYATLALKPFKFKRTSSTLVYTIVPLTINIFYTWNISKYIGILFAGLSALTIATKSFETNKQEEPTFRITYNLSFLLNISLILFGLFTLSSKGIITRLNIANIEYLFMLVIGIFLVYFINEIREAISSTIYKYSLVGTYSVIVATLITIVIFIVFEAGGTEALGTFLFGALATNYINNIFVARNNGNNSKQIAYSYLESNLLNLITVISLALMLVKV